MQTKIESNLKKIKTTFEDKEKQYEIDLQFIKQSINDNSDFGKLSLYLFTTERPTDSILNNGYNPYDTSEFSSLLHNIHHALCDDGELTFYLINKEPRFSLKNDFTLDDCLSIYEKTQEDINDCIILKNITIDNWIKLSDEYFINSIKEAFLFDYRINPNLLELYKKYSCFDIKWLDELEK